MDSQSMQQCSEVDKTFGPWAGDTCRGGFDFTLFFQETILTVPLYTIFILILPFRLYQLAKAEVKVFPRVDRLFKLTWTLALAFINGALLILWATTPSTSAICTQASIPAVAITFITSLGIIGLSWLEHTRSLRPSFFLTSFLYLSILLDLPRVRTLWLIQITSPDVPSTVPRIYSASLALRVVMSIVETVEKHDILLPDKKTLTVEDKASSLNRGVFWWLTPLLRLGYGREIELKDLYVLEEDLEPEPLTEKLRAAWHEVPDKTAGAVLFTTWMKTFVWTTLTPVIPKLMNSAFLYTQPFLVTAGIELAASPAGQPYDNYGYGLIGAYFLVYVGIAITDGQYDWQVHRSAQKMKASVIGLIYQKALRLDLSSQGTSPEAAVTLIGTDCQTITQGLIQFHGLWSGLLEIVIGIYLLSRQLGAACVMPLAVTFFILIVTGCLALPTGKAQAAWIKASEERVTTTAKTVGSIKSLRISGLNDTAFEVIRQLRTHELSVSRSCRLLLGAYLVLLIYVPLWGPALTFCVYAATGSGGGTLNLTTAFTALSLFSLVSRPLAVIIFGLPMFASGLASFGRIQEFLNRDERKDSRIFTSYGGDNDHRTNLDVSRKPEATSSTETGLGPAMRSDPSSPSSVQETVVSICGRYSLKDKDKSTIDISEPLNICRNTLTIVLGPVGCGKSTLLKAILGELSTFKGEIKANHAGVAYCGQTAWLPNETVRQIITGSDISAETYDSPRYKDVVDACALRQDFREWPRGDLTVVGTKGISMSGGQKHRIALARALYSTKELLVLDDVFSGLDMSTGESVFRKVFGRGGPIRSSNRTAILASSDVRRIRHADQIMMMNADGQIEAAGPPDIVLGTTEAAGLVRAVEQEEDITDYDENREPKSIMAKENLPEVAAIDAKSDRRFGDSAMYMFWARGIGWPTMSTFLVAMACYAGFGAFPSIWLKWWSESNITHPNEDLGKWLGVYIALTVGASVSVLLGSWQLLIVVINKSGVYFHDILLNATSRAPISFFTKVDIGTTVNRFSQDLQLIDMELPMTAFGVATSVAFAIAELILIAVSTRYLAVFVPIIVFLCYIIGHFYLRTSRQVRLLDIEYRAPLSSQLLSTIDGLITIRAYRWEDIYEAKNMSFLNDSIRPEYLLACLQRWLIFAVNMVVAIIALVLIVVVTTLREQIGPGYMGVALSNILSFSGTVEGAIISWTMLEVCLGAVSRVRSFSDETESEEASIESDEQGWKKMDDEEWPKSGEVVIRNLTAAYESSGTVLDDVSFTINPGERVAICGRTGSGKSSLALCILRMLDSRQGSILIDGINIAAIQPDHVRKRVVAVPQDSYVFDGSVRINVDPHNIASSDEHIIEVLKKVRLWEKIEARGGLDGIIGGGTNGVSHGETQLLVFARAMLRRGKVLILDEFTSSLNEESSAIIYDVLREWFRDWTIIVIAHELEAILDFDKVAVLNQGRLVEYDGPQILLRKEGSAFKTLFEGEDFASSKGKGDAHKVEGEGSR